MNGESSFATNATSQYGGEVSIADGDIFAQFKYTVTDILLVLVERLRNDDEVRQAIVNVFFRNMSSLERGFLVDGDLHVDTGYSNISSPEESATILSINSQIQTVSGARDVVKFVPGISDHFQFVPSFHENGDVECWVNVKHRRESECTIEEVS